MVQRLSKGSLTVYTSTPIPQFAVAPTRGQLSRRQDIGKWYVYDGTRWTEFNNEEQAITVAQRWIDEARTQRGGRAAVGRKG